MQGGSASEGPRPRRIGRYHLQFAGATVVAAALGAGAIAVLDDEPDPSEPSLTQRSSEAPQEPARPRLSLQAPPTEPAGAPTAVQIERRPPADRPTLTPPPDLPPLASQWRDAVIRNRRQGVLQGARALRDAPDGREQLLALLRDNNGRVRAFALRELGRRHDPSLAPVFRDHLQDESSFVVQNARWALQELQRKATK